MTRVRLKGVRTVRQRREAPTISGAQRYRARLFAKAHGYEGMTGGWIYNKDGQHVAHGWGWFYWDRPIAIESWYKIQKKRKVK